MVIIDGQENFLQGPTIEEKGLLRAAYIQTLEHQKKVTIQTFAVSQTEVTLEDFNYFLSATGYQPNRGAGCTAYAEHFPYVTFVPRAELSFRNPGFEQSGRSPVVCVTMTDAVKYARWLSAHTGYVYRLPSEAEWELLARASLADIGDVSPDGTQSTICEFENVADESATRSFEMQKKWQCSDGYGDRTAPVATYYPNHFGALDVIGNVSEYVGDCADDVDLDYKKPREWSPDDCEAYIIKGASFLAGYPAILPAGRIISVGDHRVVALGFRLVREVTER